MRKVRNFLFLLTLFCVGVLNTVAAVSDESRKPCVKMHFAGAKGSEFALLIMGSEPGEYSLDWGDGNLVKGTLKTNATRVTGVTASQDLTIYGKIAVLECSYNQLTSLDVTKMPTLTHLISRKNFIRNIDLSGNPNLKVICIQDSPLEELDLSDNPKVDSLIVTNNKMANLLLPGQSALKLLMCTSNSQLKKLDLSGCAKLGHLDAMQTMVTEYDLSPNKELTYVAVGLGRPITKFKLPDANKIDTLMLPMAGLKTLDLSQTKNLRLLATDNNFQLSALDLSGMTKLKDLSCLGNSLTELNLTNTRNLETLTCNNNQLTKLDVSGMAKLQTLMCFSNELQELKLDGCPALINLDCSMNERLSVAAFPRKLKSLNCSGCKFSKLDVTTLSELTDLNCNDNSLNELNISSLMKLTSFNCSNNNISRLDFGYKPALLDVNISNNPIVSGISFDTSPNLRYVSVNNTQMDPCALNELYNSLRKKREGEDNELGGLLLFNDVPGSAEVSTTQLATDKGWMVSVEGDGTGCDANTVVVNVSAPGALYDEAPEKVWEDAVHTLKIIGKINSYDLRVIRGFCGSDEYGSFIPKKLKRLDLSKATIVPGGTYYIVTDDQGTSREYSVEEGKDELLPDKLFFNCCTIESIVLPENIREIGIGAFYKCIELKEVVIPDQVTRINSTAFGVCNAMESIKLPTSLTHLGGYAFTHCANLKEVTIPTGVKHLHMRLFDQTAKLSKINLPSTIEKFDPESFFGAIGLEEITIPEGIDTIPESCFGFCLALRTVNLPVSLRHIGETAFQEDRALEAVHFAEGLKTIGHFAFKGCENLSSLAFPNSLEEISNEAFINCKNMQSITFGTGLKSIGEKAFFHNHGVKTLTFPAGINMIDYAAFAECADLEEVHLGMAAPQLVNNPFLGCVQLKKITVDNNNEVYAVQGGALYTKNMSRLCLYPNANGSKLKMNDATETLDDFAFWYCTNLEEVEFSSKLQHLGWRTFCGCSNLKKLTVKNTTPVENEFVDDVFEGLTKSACELSVPAGTKAAYQASRTWGGFNIVESIPDNISSAEALIPMVRLVPGGCIIEGIDHMYYKVELTDLSGRVLSASAVHGGKAVLSVSGLRNQICIATLHAAGSRKSFKIKL